MVKNHLITPSLHHLITLSSFFMKPRKYKCTICGHVYDPKEGDPDSGIAPGTAFEDIPDDWVCPICGVGKEDYIPMN